MKFISFVIINLFDWCWLLLIEGGSLITYMENINNITDKENKDYMNTILCCEL